MRKRITIGFISTCLALAMASSAKTETSVLQSPKAASGYSPLSPAPVGVAVADIIGCGRGYNSHETYDIKITLLEVLRGKEASEHIKMANTANQPPDAGFEYILARIRFEYFARGSPGDCAYELMGEQFTAVSSDGKEYTRPSLVLPKPELSGTLNSGDSLEGWVGFQVAQSDKKPLMSFTADPGGVVTHGGGVWFQLE